MPHSFKDDTLADIKARDIENLTQLFKVYKKNYTFEKLNDAVALSGQVLKGVLHRLGINIGRMSSTNDEDAGYLDTFMRSNNIRIENRVYDPNLEDDDLRPNDADFWRGGLYIYKADEIVAFIGTPVFIKDHYNVLTSVKV